MLLHFIIFLSKFLLIVAVGTFQGGTTTNNTAKPGCPTKCGSILVPYPFGVGINCSFDRSFNLKCDTSSEPPKLFLEETTRIRIHNISDTELRVFTRILYRCYNKSGVKLRNTAGINLSRDGVFTFSGKNKFTVIGCDDYAFIERMSNTSFGPTSGCVGLCLNTRDVSRGQCSGIGCCQTSMPKGLSYYNATPYSFSDHSYVLSFNKCGYSFLVEEGVFEFHGATDLSTNHLDFVKRIESTMPVVLDWVIERNKTCATEVNLCKGNSSCHDVDGGGCRKCEKGFTGNPYPHPGCQGDRMDLRRKCHN